MKKSKKHSRVKFCVRFFRVLCSVEACLPAKCMSLTRQRILSM